MFKTLHFAGTRKTVPVFLSLKIAHINIVSMKLLFSDESSVQFLLNSTPVSEVYQKICKHLQHITLPFQPWDCPYYVTKFTYIQLINELVKYAAAVGVEISINKCLAHDQQYFNIIHKIYEQNYNGDPAWLRYHEHIHLCERYYLKNLQILFIDYREKSGLLEKKIDYNWITNTTSHIKKGQIYIDWAELGKTPYNYWNDGEPDNIDRLNILCKPWLIFRPKIAIALDDNDFLKNKNIDSFTKWWSRYEQDWCKHWNVPKWGIEEIFGVSVIGEVDNIDFIINNIKTEVYPVGVKL